MIVANSRSWSLRGSVPGVARRIRRLDHLRPVTTTAVLVEHAIDHQPVEVDMTVEVAAEPVHECDGAEPRTQRGSRAILADGRFHRPEKYTE